jgi:predicted PurR-regulated permease PerM
MSEKVKNLVNVLILNIIIIALLIAGETILIPAAWALLFAFIGLPISNLLERKKSGTHNLFGGCHAVHHDLFRLDIFLLVL